MIVNSFLVVKVIFSINVTFQTLKYTIENISLFHFSVSLGDFSDTSVDENSAKKKMNDFHISDDEEKNSPKLSFLKTKRSKTDVMKDESVFSMKNAMELAPDGSEDVALNPLSEPQNKDHKIETEKIKVKPKPRILPVKSTSSGNLLGHCNCIF